MPFDSFGQELRLEALAKIGRVIDLLSRRDRWCKGALKTADGRMCILGAVREADAELLLYAPILRAIREVTGYGYRQIEHFNDGWVANHSLVMTVLEQAQENLSVGLTSAVRAPPRPAKLNLSARFRRWLGE
jgi:hypothetical protein